MRTITSRRILTLLSVWTVVSANALTTPAETVIFVDASAAAGGDGMSWASAFSDLQDGLDLARQQPDVGAIWVANGEYAPDRGTGDRDASFELVAGVQLLGGFAGNETEAAQRNPLQHATILTADLTGDDQGGDGIGADENTRVVVRATGLNPAGTLDGFQVRAANNDGEIAQGGGISVQGGAADVRQCFIIRNRTHGSGGAIFAAGAGHLTIADTTLFNNAAVNGAPAAGLFIGSDMTADVTDTVFYENKTFSGDGVDPGLGGGAHLFRAGEVSFERCEFLDNDAQIGGGLSAVLSTDIRIVDCVFVNNYAMGPFGAAIHLDRSDNPPFDDHPTIIDRCMFFANHTDPGLAEGSAIFATNNVVHISNSSFMSNVVGGFDEMLGEFLGRGTVAIRFGEGHRIENCLFANNIGGMLGGVVVSEAAQIKVNNSAFVGNTNQNFGVGAGLLVTPASSLDLDNTIFWDNKAIQKGVTQQGEQTQLFVVSPASTVDFSLIQDLDDGFGGIGNIGDEPVFANPSGPDGFPGTLDDDYRLAAGSPGIDAGTNLAVTSGTNVDLNGNPRFVDDPATGDTGQGQAPLVDVGPFEFGPDCSSDVDPPVLIHGDTPVSFAHVAFGGYIDPRAASDNGADLNLGIDRVSIVFSERVFAVGGSELSDVDFEVRITGDGPAPNIISVTRTGLTRVEIVFDNIIPLQEWTTIVARVVDQCGNAIEDQGDLGPGTDEPDRVDVAFLPGDVDSGGDVSPFDLLRFRQVVNDGVVPEQGSPADFVDMDRDGSVAPFDLLRFRQMINGVAPATQSWAGRTLNADRP